MRCPGFVNAVALGLTIGAIAPAYAEAVVTRFIHVWPGETCERNSADASLTNTYWRIVRLGDEAIRPSEIPGTGGLSCEKTSSCRHRIPAR